MRQKIEVPFSKIISYMDYYVRYLEDMQADIDALGNIKASAILYQDILYVAEAHQVIYQELPEVYKRGKHYDALVHLSSGKLIELYEF